MIINNFITNSYPLSSWHIIHNLNRIALYSENNAPENGLHGGGGKTVKYVAHLFQKRPFVVMTIEFRHLAVTISLSKLKNIDQEKSYAPASCYRLYQWAMEDKPTIPVAARRNR